MRKNIWKMTMWTLFQGKNGDTETCKNEKCHQQMQKNVWHLQTWTKISSVPSDKCQDWWLQDGWKGLGCTNQCAKQRSHTFNTSHDWLGNHILARSSWKQVTTGIRWCTPQCHNLTPKLWSLKCIGWQRNQWLKKLIETVLESNTVCRILVTKANQQKDKPRDTGWNLNKNW